LDLGELEAEAQRKEKMEQILRLTDIHLLAEVVGAHLIDRKRGQMAQTVGVAVVEECQTLALLEVLGLEMFHF
jgi:hypothetical protein